MRCLSDRLLDCLLNHQPETRLTQLRNGLQQALTAVQSDYTLLRQAGDWLHQLATRLDPDANPQRTGAPPSATEHRLAMARLAFAGEPRAVIDDREILRGGPSYTVDTLEALAHEHPGEQMRLLLGGDQALNFHTWRSPERIVQLAEPVVVPRAPLGATALARELEDLGGTVWRARILPIDPQPHASTALRQALAQGTRPAAEQLDPQVTDYALRHGLYRGG